MSTIPLKHAKATCQSISGSDTPPTTIERDDGALDALIESATETVTNRDQIKEDDDTLLKPIEGEGWAALASDPDRPAPTEREAGLEKVMRGREAKLAEREAESAEFHASQESRETLRHRYKGQVSVEQLLENATDWHHYMTANPHMAADQLASAYLQAAPYAINDDPPPKKAEAPADEHRWRSLDRILEDAWDKRQNGDPNQQEFKASAKQRAALKAMFPGMSFADAMRSLVKFDGDMHRDPLATAARMGASYGMPITAGQHVAAQADYERTAPVVQMVEHTAQYLPNYADISRRHDPGSGAAGLRSRERYAAGPHARLSDRGDCPSRNRDAFSAENAEKRKPKPRGGLDGLLDNAFARAGM